MMDNQINMQDTRVIPADYKQTEVGIIPADWDVLPLSKLSTRITDGEHLTPERAEFGYYLLSARNIQNGYLDLSDVDYVGEKEYLRIRKRCNPEEGDVLISCSGTIGRISVLPRGIECVMVRSAALVKPSASKLNGHYMQYFLQSKIGQSQIFASLNQGAQANLFLNHIQNISLALPQKFYEQTAIAKVLSDTDALITVLEELIAKKQAIKIASMQQLLTGRTRLPQFAKQPSGAIKNYKSSELGIIPDDWETVAMGEMGVTYGGLSGKSKNDFGSGNSLYVPFTNIMANVIVNVNHLERVNVQETQRQVLPGDLLFNGSSETPEEVCFCSLMSEEIDKLYLNSFCFGFRANSQPKYLPLYIAYWFRSSAGRTAVSIMAQGSTRYNISKSQFLTLKIVLPPILEQTAIATVLSDMDAELEKLEQKLAKIRDIKQGMMQQLLTGRIRLPLDHQP
ncbi:restriction endonuclease subunit S [Klebsiella aerogenes]|uniref:restriction endonuclease subunit S n=1 Tax=Klebsiella aerogenes TaxID=548 RepID=UPI001BCEF360|nr:restriction endonuclease subunit S [Klebsiella aerogenes]